MPHDGLVTSKLSCVLALALSPIDHFGSESRLQIVVVGLLACQQQFVHGDSTTARRNSTTRHDTALTIIVVDNFLLSI